MRGQHFVVSAVHGIFGEVSLRRKVCQLRCWYRKAIRASAPGRRTLIRGIFILRAAENMTISPSKMSG